MRKLKTLVLLASLAIFAIGLSGCATPGLTQQQVADQWSVRAFDISRETALTVITPPIGNPSNRPILQAASDGLGVFVTRTNASPEEFYADLAAVDPSLSSPLYFLFIDGVAVVYDEFYYQLIASSTNSTWLFAQQVVASVQRGIDSALGQAGPILITPRPLIRVPTAAQAFAARQRHAQKPKFFPVVAPKGQ